MADHRLTLADDGATLDIVVGDTILIDLAEQSGGGYEWHGPIVGHEFHVAAGGRLEKAPAVGASTPYRLVLRAILPVETELRLQQFRAWEGPARAITEFHVRVRVR